MRKIKVLQVIGSLRVGGAELVALNFYKYIDRTRFSFDYLVYGEEIGKLEDEVYRLGGRVIRISSPKNGYLKFIKNVRKIMQSYGPYDIVHSHPLFNSGFIVKAGYMEKIPIRIAHAHSSRYNEKSSLLKKVYMEFMRYNMRKFSTHLFACSKDAGNYLFGEKWFKEKGYIIKNGIDVEKYVYNESIRNKVRRELQLNGEFLVGNVGRLCDAKNQNFILDIFKKIKENHLDSKLVFVGDGPLKEQLKKRAQKLNIENDVLFLGIRNDVNQLLQGMDVFVFPSKYEGFGIAVVEAQAAGLQCIISNSIPEEVEITNLVDRVSLSANASTWAEKILKYRNGYKRRNMQKELVLKGYDINLTMQKVFDIYNQLEKN